MQLSADQFAQFDQDGFLLFPGLLTDNEIAAMRDEIERLMLFEDDCIIREGTGGEARTLFRVHEEDGSTASQPFRDFSRSPRALGSARDVLEDDALYLHHTKINIKCGIEGTAWPWHQDFGQWHLDGIAKPDLVTLMVMLDAADELSGCLYFLPGSHRRGRIEPRWDETTPYRFLALPPRSAREAFADGAKPVAITGKPGDAALFHCNLFHASGHNLSPDHRRQAYFCYNRVANRPQDVADPRPEYVRSLNWAPLKMLEAA
jgi:ectoine hydroxylase